MTFHVRLPAAAAASLREAVMGYLGGFWVQVPGAVAVVLAQLHDASLGPLYLFTLDTVLKPAYAPAALLLCIQEQQELLGV